VDQEVKNALLRDYPSYTIPEACHYLNLAESTVRYWVAGKGGEYEPVIIPASTSRPTLLSFINLAEVHVLGTITREHKVKLPRVRTAVDYLKQEFKSDHPLIDHKLATDGSSLFIERFGELINISERGQLAMLINSALERIEWDARGLPVKLFPFTRTNLQDSPRIVLIQPGLAFGRPVINGTGIPTEIIAERYKAGDSVEDLVKDYGREEKEIEEAIRCELRAA